ncbi:MAG: type III pantothenate kinase [Acidimicrobiia bacterium]|nr:MAG: type III pantothenate kinase [Acidimicrobiia bacterium]
MLLTIDVGNTQVALGMFDHEELVGHWRLSTNSEATFDEARWQLAGILGADGFTQSDIRGVAISSVVPAMTAALRRVAPHLTSGRVVVVEPGVRTGMSIEIDNPREVGADRIVNALAARERYGAPVVVVDFGTSTNFDVVGLEGAYLGGAIAPGLEISTNALISGTATLRKVEFSPPRSVIGKGTVEAIQSGGLYGHAGLVDGIVERIAAEFDEPVTRVATGGLASTIVPHCSSVDTVDPYLTLEGLRIIFDYNQDVE